MKRTMTLAATLGMAFGAASATNSPEPAPEARAYVFLSFGGERMQPRDFHYGLRIDHDSRFVDRAVPPLMQFDFTPRGLSAARVNGLNVLAQRYRLRQAEDIPAQQEPVAPAEVPAEAPAEVPAEGAAVEGVETGVEEPGFFSRMWKGITGIFGGDDEEAGEAAEEPSLGLRAVDWGLIAVGAVGLGLALSDSDDSSGGGTTGGADGSTTGGTGGSTTGGTDGGTTGGTLGGLAGGLGGSTTTVGTTGETTGGTTSGLLGGLAGGTGGLVGGLTGGLLGYAEAPASDYDRDPEYRRWLDGGTGQMGDLGGG